MSDEAAGSDFLIIGAGIAGVFLANELQARGAAVTLVEAQQVCAGSSGLNAGGVRQQFSQEINIALARRTVARLTSLTQQPGVDLSYHQVGYMFMVSDEKSAQAFQGAIQLQNSLDVPTRWLSTDEVSDLMPAVITEDLVGAAFCPTDGYLDPHSLVTHVSTAARRAGARIITEARVVGFDHSGETISGVQLSTGQTLVADTIVNCAGAWANGIAGLYGAALPIMPWRAQCALLQGVVGVPKNCPVTIDFNNGKTYLHGESGGFLVGTDANDGCDPSWRLTFDESRTELLVQRLISRYDAFDDAQVKRGWAGLLELTPDENPISDWTHFANLYTMAGFSGHGLAIAPGLSGEVAALLTGSQPSIDLAPYRGDRFDSSQPQQPAEALSMR